MPEITKEQAEALCRLWDAASDFVEEPTPQQPDHIERLRHNIIKALERCADLHTASAIAV